MSVVIENIHLFSRFRLSECFKANIIYNLLVSVTPYHGVIKAIIFIFLCVTQRAFSKWFYTFIQLLHEVNLT